MSALLVIQAHPHIADSLSLTVGQRFTEAYKRAHPDDQVIIRDLFAEGGVPPLNDVTMVAWRKQKNQEPLTADEEALLQHHHAWLNEFIAADKYVFINPMYNHFLPAEMKQYLDLTAVAHKTFQYTANGPVGLLEGKRALHIQASGSEYHQGDQGVAVQTTTGDSQENFNLMDLGDIYLTTMLHFYGITDISKLFIEGADAHRDQRPAILNRALAQAESIAQDF